MVNGVAQGNDVDLKTKKEEYKHEDEEEAEEDHTAPSRWWFSSTLFPLIAGTFGPMASAFNLCALIIDWRIVVSPSSSETEGLYLADPAWLLAVNAVSLIIAVLANLALLSQMFGRLPFHIASPSTIGGWFISSFLLIGLVAAAPAHLPLPAGQARTFSQAYYYACLAAVVYFLLASMLVVTALGVFLGRYSHDFKLTFSQRTLMFQVILFLCYLLSAAAVYARIEDWDYLDAVYYVDVTLFTIGFGDFSPKTHLGRGLFFPMAIGGILFVGLIIASISTLVLDRGSKKVSIRMVEKARQQALKNFDPKTGTVRIRKFQKRKFGEYKTSNELDRREQEFNIMREVQVKAANNNRMIALSISLGAVLILWLIGAVVFWQAEKAGQNWSYFESLYFTYVSLLTIGYGDFYPQDNSAKPVFVFWSLLALPTLTVLIGSIGDIINEGVNTFVLYLGDHLPNTGALSEVKGEASKIKGDEFKEAKPPGFLDDGRSDAAVTDNQFDAEAVKGMSQNMQRNERGKEHGAAGKHYRHYLLMKEMKNVVQHMDATPPRKYSFAEWTWFLKLLGQDESNEARHRKPWDLHNAEEAADNANSYESQGDVPNKDGQIEAWSWLGRRSPLISSTDEPKWVLEKLMGALEKELREQGEGNLEKERNGTR